MREFINEEGVKMVEMPRNEFDCLLAQKAKLFYHKTSFSIWDLFK